MNSNSNGIEIARFRKLDCCSESPVHLVIVLHA